MILGVPLAGADHVNSNQSLYLDHPFQTGPDRTNRDRNPTLPHFQHLLLFLYFFRPPPLLT